MAAVSSSRVTALLKLRSTIFQTAWNPTGIRTGAKYLRGNLRGPAMANYYPMQLSISKIAGKYPELELCDEDEQERLDDVASRKKRGKGAPKKAKDKSQSRRLGKRR
ncbi:mitochondrial ribosomal subunit S27-domain-containing protein [Ephemerocybe angulata]|uniref:Small ribosomal subunit protein mS33 n=1 Tax=Ephemerocybe angulata TaxID=980116 RepID=A0A8H6I7W0_9AGAR|nr:mitochondrial ribosomal subunit S27-domain-containing protein [Tulosesus angulatus]